MRSLSLASLTLIGAIIAPRPLHAQVQWTSSGFVVCNEAGTQHAPTVTSDWTSGTFVVWGDNRVGAQGVYAQRLTSSGTAQWTSGGIKVSEQPGADFPALVPDGTGGAIVVWTRSSDYGLSAQRIDASGNRLWANDVTVALGTWPPEIMFPRICSDGNGGVIAVWNDHRHGNADVYAQRILNTGSLAWTANGFPVCTASGDQHVETVALDGTGGVVIPWGDYRSDPYGDVYAQRVLLDGTPAWAASGVPIRAEQNVFEDFPIVAADRTGGTIIGWGDARATAGGLYAQRLSSTGGALWTPDGVQVSSGGTQGTELAVNEDGHSIFAWTFGAVFAQKLDENGNRMWGSGDLVVADPAGAEEEAWAMGLVADSHDGAVITWRDNRSGLYLVYAQRINSFGAPLWAQDGVLLGSSLVGQALGLWSTLALDDLGGAVVVWLQGSDIYAQRLFDPATTASDSPALLSIGNSYPNPFNPLTHVPFVLPAAGRTHITIHDVGGALVRTLVDEHLGVGPHEVVWDGKNDAGSVVSSGVYILRLEHPSGSGTTKLVAVK